jgi:hypothetical protein
MAVDTAARGTLAMPRTGASAPTWPTLAFAISAHPTLTLAFNGTHAAALASLHDCSGDKGLVPIRL